MKSAHRSIAERNVISGGQAMKGGPSSLLLLEQGIRVNINALPIFLRIRHQGNREMQMIIPCSGVSGIADIGEGLTLPGKVSFRQALGILIQVRIVKDESAVSAQLVNGRAATVAVKKFNDGSV